MIAMPIHYRSGWVAAGMNPQVFREYDIRGVVETDFDDDFVTDLGRAFGTMLARAGKRTIAVGRDCRLTSDRLRDLISAGLLASGIDLIDIGVVPTPLLYFSMLEWKMDGGLMITGSHNSAEFNGFKLGVGPSTIHGAEILKLRTMIERRDFLDSPRRGSVSRREVIPEYCDYVASRFKLAPGLRVVVDGGNGCGGVVGVPLMRRLGVEVIELYTEMDGRFPNHHPDPTVESNMSDLIDTVRRERAIVGIAYDGDADRIGAVDENGRIVWGDELMVAFSRAILANHPGATIIGEVKCSQRMYDDIERHGGRAIMWKTGHSLMKQKLKQERAALAGEMSGHMFFADRYFGFDDAIYASIRLLELIGEQRRGLGAILADLPPSHFTPEIRLDCPDDRKFEVVRRAAEFFRRDHQTIDIDGVRVNFGDGWGLVRASNTQPALVMRFEASSAARRDEIRAIFERKLSELGAM
jgi:phosphomannomutase/phosphoglucomutase